LSVEIHHAGQPKRFYPFCIETILMRTFNNINMKIIILFFLVFLIGCAKREIISENKQFDYYVLYKTSSESKFTQIEVKNNYIVHTFNFRVNHVESEIEPIIQGPHYTKKDMKITKRQLNTDELKKLLVLIQNSMDFDNTYGSATGRTYTEWLTIKLSGKNRTTGVYNSSKDTPQAFYAIRDYLLKLAEF